MAETYLDRGTILAAKDIKTEEVEVPEWGGTVRVRGMTGSERDEFEAEVAELRRGGVEVRRKHFRARLLLKTVVDEGGKALFAPADLEALGGKSVAALDRLVAVAMRLNGIEPASVEVAAKN